MKTDKQIKKIVINLGYKFIKSYRKNTDIMVHVVDTNGYKYSPAIKNLKNPNQGMAFVHKLNPYSLYNISLWLKINNKTFRLLRKNIYKKAYGYLNFHCNVCNENFKLKWANVFQGRGCTYCSGRTIGKKNNLKYLYPELCKEWSKNNPVSPKVINPNSSEKFEWKCRNCNGIWNTSPFIRTHGSGCPICKQSKGEKRIEKFLIDNKLRFFRQKRLMGCMDKHHLIFDFYLPDYNMCIEYNGIQHYESVKWFTAGQGLSGVKRRDKIKRNFCEKNGISLLIIKYTDFKKINDILKSKIE